MALTPPFASTSDLEDRWRILSADETARATVLLTDASQMLLDEDTQGRLSSLTEPTPTVIRVVCAMVRRAMASPVSIGPDISNLQQTTGPFSQGVTYANPSGDLYLSKAERRTLRFSRQRAGGVDMWTPPVTS